MRNSINILFALALLGGTLVPAQLWAGGGCMLTEESSNVSGFLGIAVASCSGSSTHTGGTATPTPTPPPQTCAYLQNLYVNTSQTYFQSRDPNPYILDIQYAIDLWKNVLGCPSTVLAQVIAQPAAAPAHTNMIVFVPQSLMSLACPAWANETDTDLNLVARVCFLENYGGDQNNPILSEATRYKIVVNSDKQFATSNQFCFAGTCYPGSFDNYWLFQTVISHELGHAMGLDDVVIPNSGDPGYTSIMNTYRVGATGKWAPGMGLPSLIDGLSGHTAVGCSQ